MAAVTCTLGERVLVVGLVILTGWGRLHALSGGGAGLLKNHVAGRTFEPADWAVDKLEMIVLGLNNR